MNDEDYKEMQEDANATMRILYGVFTFWIIFLIVIILVMLSYLKHT